MLLLRNVQDLLADGRTSYERRIGDPFEGPIILASCEKDNLQKALLGLGWQKVPNWECLFVHREGGLFLPVFVNAVENWLEEHKTSILCGRN